MNKNDLEQLQTDLKAIQELCKTETPEQAEVLWEKIIELRDSPDLEDTHSNAESIYLMLDEIIWERWGDDGENNNPTCDFKGISLDCANLINEIQDME